ncbi:MAG: ATP-binding cassette domain-containing protein [Chloroflexi bacterium]|nr:ATP-binding cassette domain-containing protein [Chloroflexota bacterium]
MAEVMGRETPRAIEAQDVWFSYNRSQPVLKGVSLQVEPGILCMILGPSGSGKTTLLKALKGLVRPQRGSIMVLGAEVTGGLRGKVGRELGRRVAYIPQTLGLVRNLTVLQNALVGALGRTSTLASLVRVFPTEYVLQAREVLQTLGLGHKLDEKGYHLSGGERQRVAIARALMQNPRVILADEFVSQLDTPRALEIMDIVRGIARQGVTLVITTHELELVARYGDKAVFLSDGEKVHEGSASAVNLETLMRWMK